MAREFLKPIYRDVYGDEFNQACFESRMEMQKLVYVLQEAGVTIGDYDFLWYKHGPYSQELQNDILTIFNVPNVELRYSSDASLIINRVKEVFAEKTVYSRSCWVECIASLQYLKSSRLSLDSSDEVIVDYLMKVKTHLNNRELNIHALNRLKYIMGQCV